MLTRTEGSGNKTDRATGGAAQSAFIRAQWQRTAVLIALGLAVIAACYWPVVTAAVTVWYHSTSYNHCFLIPVITAYLLWERRSVFATMAPEPTAWPIVGIFGLSVVALAGSAMNILEVQQFALVGMMQLFVLALVGWPVFKAIMFPMLYLFFMVPTGEFLVPKLQDFTAAFIVAGLQLVNIPVFSDGIFIRIPNGLFEVAEACAGLRFLIASVAFGFLFAYLMYRSWRKRVVFVALSFIIPIIANGFRAFGIVIIAHLSDNKLAAGVDHIVYGWGFFVAIMLTMMWVGLKFRDPETPIATSTLSPAMAGAPLKLAAVIGLAAVLASLAGPAYAYWQEYRHPVHTVSLTAPAAPSPWQAESGGGSPWRPTFQGADGELSQTYVGPGTAHLYVAYYTFQRYGAKIISGQNRIEDEDNWRRASSGIATATVDGQSMQVSKQVLTGRNQQRRVAWFFYWVDRQFTANPLRAKLLGARGTLLSGNPEAAVVVIAADVTNTEEEAEARLRDLLGKMEISAFLERAASR